MHATGVVPLKVVSDVGARGAHAVIGFEVNPFVLHAAPETFNKDVVAPGAAPVHRQLAAFGEHRVGEFGGRELAALIGVDDLGRAVAGEGLLDDLSGVTGLQRDGYLVREHAAAGDIHHGGEVDEAARHRNVGRIQRPHLVRVGDGQPAQQIRINLVPRVRFAGARLRCQRLNTHAMHERGDVTPACVNAQFRQLPAQHARPHERMLKMQFVQAAHERQISGTGRLRQIINRASADLQQFRLARDGQIVVTDPTF